MIYKILIALIIGSLFIAWSLDVDAEQTLKKINSWISEFFSQKDHEEENEEHRHSHKEPHSHAHEPSHAHEDENLVKLSEQQIHELGIKTLQATPGNLSFVISTPAKITILPHQLAHILPKISGIARQADKNIGDFVKVGDIMATLDSRDIAEIKANYLAALSKQRLAASVLKREENLYKEKISPIQDYMNAKNVYEEAAINVQLSLEKLRAYGFNEQEIYDLTRRINPNLSIYYIRAPIDGQVISRHITKGEFIESNKTIYEVADLRKVWLEIGIYPKDLPHVHVGQIVEVSIPSDNLTARARIIYVSPIVAKETITAKAVAELDNAKGIWRPGTFVKVHILTDQKNVRLVVKKSAIQRSEGKDFLFVVTPEGYEKRFVKLGLSDREKVEILSGLNLGEEYVTDQAFLLKAELGKKSAEHHH